jgi:alpha-mannosidase
MIKSARMTIVLLAIGGVIAAGRAQDRSDLTLYMVGQSHIDAAWRWRWPETIDVCRDTFGQAIRLTRDYPGFKYTQSQAVLYAAMEEHYPKLFAEIRKAVAKGNWSIVGGMWVEPDVNMPSGESLVRQCLHGQRYFREKFGVESRIGWLPDSFGMPWTLPQILKKSHMDSVAFAKFRFGAGPLLMWEGPDGSQVLLHNARTTLEQLGKALGNPPNFSRLPEALKALARESGTNAIVLPYGVGDHGGGPTRREIQMFRTWTQVPGMPKIKLASADEAIGAMKREAGNLPVWRDEINYLDRGCYTSQAETKRRNRKCETLLTNVEKFAVMAKLAAGFEYPRQALRTAWRGVLFNQFHDILPGSSIGPVHADAIDLYRDVETASERTLEEALAVLAAQASTEGQGQPVIVFNSLSWPRSDIVQVTLDYDRAPAHVTVRDASGHKWPAQIVGKERIYQAFDRCQVIFAARDVPALGFRVFWVEQADAPRDHGLMTGNYWLESPRFRLEVDSKTGHLTALLDKHLSRQVLASGAPGNLLRLLGDDSGGSTAWEIKYTGEVEELGAPTHVEVVERGPVRATIGVGYLRNGSVYEQRISVYDGLDRVDFQTTIDWRERHKLLKVCFPVAVKAGSFVREIPFGNIAHDCNGEEVPAQKWIDVSDSEWGVSLLNDSKYGHSVDKNEMAITLLRSPTDPDPVADLGRHTVTYSLYPHAGGWRDALTQRRGEELNAPLLARVVGRHEGSLGSQHAMLSVEPESTFVSAVKLAEDSGDIVIRIWEAHGRPSRADLRLFLPVVSAVEVDLLENQIGRERPVDWRLIAPLKPYEIRTFKLRLQGQPPAERSRNRS